MQNAKCKMQKQRYFDPRRDPDRTAPDLAEETSAFAARETGGVVGAFSSFRAA
jgi:hypothetical protein